MKNKITLLSFLAFIGAVIVAGIPSVMFADDDYRSRGRTYEVTVTNITSGETINSGQILNGLVVAAHNRNFRLFELGRPASEELALTAEDAMNEGLVAALQYNRNVCAVTEIGLPPILPGESVTVKIRARGNCRYFSMAAMLVSSNDAFAALNGVRLKRGSSYLATAYDAGSEANTEDCGHIPGPPCGSGGVRVGGGEGYVSIHSGIHGIGGGNASSDLNPSLRDWNNPVASITIR